MRDLGEWWNGIHATLKMSSTSVDKGSTPFSPTRKNEQNSVMARPAITAKSFLLLKKHYS
ncbi:MAG: hypothetical protein UU92_C0028G0011 [candidate division WWE3 bacterium GW2011_GWA1_42_12]|nr:MAG: hypothetical protein UU92_C0028G0011 [candidate division WWE3 bacterium GW2011_GWA1_42_12]